MASQEPVAFRDLHEFTALFDRERFGLNVSVGVMYFVGQVMSAFAGMVLPLLQGQGIAWSPPAYDVVIVVQSAVEAAAFVVVVHRARDVGSLLVAWGAVLVILGAANRGVLTLLAFDGWSVPSIRDPLLLGSAFAYGVLLIYGMVLAVRRWAALPWSFIAGAAGGLALHSVVFRVAYFIRDPALGTIGSWVTPVVVGGAIDGVSNGAILGGLVYLGLARHMKRRGVAGPAAAERPGGAPVASVPGAVTPTPVTAGVTASSPDARQHWFVCCPNPSLIKAFMEVYAVARAAGWGEYRKLHASVFSGEFAALTRAAQAATVPFPGKEFMGAQSWDTTSLESVLTQIQAGATQEIHVAYGVTTAGHADWMKTTYETLIGEALKQGILPFRMYMTESEAAAAVLLAAFAEG